MTAQHPAAPETERCCPGCRAKSHHPADEACDGCQCFNEGFYEGVRRLDNLRREQRALPAAPETDVSALLNAYDAAIERIHELAERLRVVEGERDAALRSKAALVSEVQRLQDQIARASMEPGQDRQKAMHAYAARAESAEAVIAKVERIVSDAEERDRQSLSRTFSGGTFGAYIPAADLRALLPGDGR